MEVTGSRSYASWSANATADYETYFKNHWTTKVGGIYNYNKTLQDGVLSPSAAVTTTVSDSTVAEAKPVAVASTTMSGAGFTGNVLNVSTSNEARDGPAGQRVR